MGLRILFESRYTWVCLYMLTGVLEVSPKWFTFGKLRALSTYHDLDEGLTSQYLLLWMKQMHIVYMETSVLGSDLPPLS